MNTRTVQETIPVCGSYDVIVAGGGVAGIAAALAAARAGKNVLLLEKTINLGGLATNGLVNLFVPMCNGRGTQIIKGMAQELLDKSIQYGYDTIPEDWKNGQPKKPTTQRYMTRFSAPIFSLVLNEMIQTEGIHVLFDTVVSRPLMDGKHCEGLIVENKSGTQLYLGNMVIDATGDADILYRAGVPTIQGKNYHTYYAFETDVKRCEQVAQTGNMNALQKSIAGAGADLYGRNHPEGKPYWKGTDANDVSQYVQECQTALLNQIKGDDRCTRDIYLLPSMPQFRTTRHIDGDYTLQEADAYLHFPDSIAAICDFDRRDYLYEVPYGTLICSGYDNLITAGRSAAADGYAWDVLRVIPPAILTGQAAGNAAALAMDSNCGIDHIDVAKLQKNLENQNVMIHFDDALIPTDKQNSGEHVVSDHI